MQVNRHEQTHMVPDPRFTALERRWVNQHSAVMRSMIGAWRWPIVQKHGEVIQQAIVGKRAIDFGGFAGPIGYGAIVVDYQAPHDQPRSLYDIAGTVDTIFSSHTVEHLSDPVLFFQSCYAKIREGGLLIVQVPSWRKEHLRAGNWPFHEQTFCLEGDDCEFTPLDTMMRDCGFTIELVDSYNENILVIARR
jgi:SAM-dependent methyltransferase